jgi:hypothetical protein
MERLRAGAAARVATAIMLTLAPPAAAQAPSPLGEWITEGGKARVRLAPCSGEPAAGYFAVMQKTLSLLPSGSRK